MPSDRPTGDRCEFHCETSTIIPKDLENRGETNAIGKPLQFWINFIQALTSFIEEDEGYYKEIFMKYAIDPVQITGEIFFSKFFEGFYGF